MALQWPQCVFPVQRNPLHPAPTAASTTSTSTTPVPTPTPTSSPAPRPAENRRADRRADRRVVSAPLFFLLPFPPSKAHHTTSNTFAARRQQPAGALTMVCEQCVHSLHCLLHSLYGLLLLPRTATQSCCAACQKLSAVTHEPVCTKALCTGHCVCLCRLLLPLLLLLLPSSSRRRWQSSLVSLLGRALPPQTGTRRRLRDHTHTSCDRNSRGDGGRGSDRRRKTVLDVVAGRAGGEQGPMAVCCATGRRRRRRALATKAVGDTERCGRAFWRQQAAAASTLSLSPWQLSCCRCRLARAGEKKGRRSLPPSGS